MNDEIIYITEEELPEHIEEIERSFAEYTYIFQAFYGKEYMQIDKLREYFEYKKNIILINEYEQDKDN